MKAVLVCALVVVSTAPAAAEPLGRPGQVAIASDFELSFTTTRTREQFGDDTRVEIRVAPAVDVFVAPHLSLGGQLLYEHRDDDFWGSTQLGAAVRAGYAVNLGAVSVWPRAGVAVRRGDGNVVYLGDMGENGTVTALA